MRRVDIIGKLKITWTHTAVYINLATFFFVLATFHSTTGHPWLKSVGLEWVSIPVFLVFVLSIVGIFAVIFVYRVDVPSSLGWYYDILCTYGKVYRKDTDGLSNAIKELKLEIEALRSELNGIQR